MDELRVGIVGVGIGQANALAIAGNARGRVTALCDLNEPRMAEFAAKLPGEPRLFTDYTAMCAWDGIDAVMVGTPNQWHVPVGLEAVRQGKHVLMTKPLADRLEPAREMVAAQEAAGVVGMMSLSMRSGQDIRYLGGLSHSGELGEVYYARARSIRRSGIPYWSPGFILKGGGAFRDMGVHALDAAWWILGCPQPVSVTGVAGAKFAPRGLGYNNYDRPGPEVVSQWDADDYGGGFIRFANGAGLQIESFWASHQANEFNLELFGTDAGAKLKPLTVYRTVNDAPHDCAVTLPREDCSAWDYLAGQFIATVLDGAENPAPLRHGLVVQEMLEGLLESAEVGREVRLGEE